MQNIAYDSVISFDLNPNYFVYHRRNTMTSREQQVQALTKDWAENPRWKGVKRGYDAVDVVKLRGSLKIEAAR